MLRSPKCVLLMALGVLLTRNISGGFDASLLRSSGAHRGTRAWKLWPRAVLSETPQRRFWENPHPPKNVSDEHREGLAAYLEVKLAVMDLSERMVVMACRDLFGQVDGRAQRKTQKPAQKGAVSCPECWEHSCQPRLSWRVVVVWGTREWGDCKPWWRVAGK